MISAVTPVPLSYLTLSHHMFVLKSRTSIVLSLDLFRPMYDPLTSPTQVHRSLVDLDPFEHL